MNELLITEEFLINAGFEYIKNESEMLKPVYLNDYGIKDYKVFRKWTDDEYPIKLDIDNGWNNRGTKWSLHIDNEACETIGYADIDYVWQFNSLMEIFNSKFKLPLYKEYHSIDVNNSKFIKSKFDEYYELIQNLIEDIETNKNEILNKRVNHLINSKELDVEYEKQQHRITYLHNEFVNSCYEITLEIYRNHSFELSTQSNFEKIKLETLQALDKFYNTFKYNLNPRLIYDIIFGSQCWAEKIDIKNGYINDYMYINFNEIIRNDHYIKKYILELFGFKDLIISEQ